MKKTLMRCAVLIAVLSLLASCGGGGSEGGASTLSLLDSTGGPLLATSVTATQGAAVPNVQVFVSYTSPPVAAVAAGYPPGGTDPRTVGIDILQLGTPSDNPLKFELTFATNGSPGTYNATWRFAAFDANWNVLGFTDLPVTLKIN